MFVVLFANHLENKLIIILWCQTTLILNYKISYKICLILTAIPCFLCSPLGHMNSCFLANIFDIFDVWQRGPSLPAAIPGFDFPLGLCLADAPDLMGAMKTCPRKGSLCHDKLILSLPFTVRLTFLSSIFRQEDNIGYISTWCPYSTRWHWLMIQILYLLYIYPS